MTRSNTRAQKEADRDADRLRAFRDLYEREEAKVRKTLYWLAGAEAANDLVQEVFIKAWNRFDQFRGDSQVATWLHRISVHVAYDHFRKAKRSLGVAGTLGEVVVEVGTAGEAGRLELHQAIQIGIRALPEKLRAAFVLFYQQGLTLEEVAAALEVPIGTIKSRLHEGREIFKEELKKWGVNYEG